MGEAIRPTWHGWGGAAGQVGAWLAVEIRPAAVIGVELDERLGIGEDWRRLFLHMLPPMPIAAMLSPGRPPRAWLWLAVIAAQPEPVRFADDGVA